MENLNIGKRALIVLCLILVIGSVFSVTSLAAGETISKNAPNNGQSFSFSVPIQVNESEAYAGIQFNLEIEDPQYLSYSFVLSPEVKARKAKLYDPVSNPNQFGFWCDDNVFSGNITVGELNITYTGDKPQAIYISRMRIGRVNGNTTDYVEKDSPVHTISVSRDGTQSFCTVTFDPKGGARTGGGELVQTVPMGGSAVEPIVIRSGYNFEAWDKSFNNITSDTTVTAKWIAIAGSGGQTPGNPTGGSSGAGGPGSSGTDAGSSVVTTIGGINTPLSGSKIKSDYFDDMDGYLWAMVEVDLLFERGVVTGTSDRMYSPSLNIKRGDFILMLVRAYGLTSDFSENFADVPTGSYYYNAIGTAKKLMIAQGLDENHFAPEAPITRQDMMTLVYRTLKSQYIPMPEGSETDLVAFPDKDLISDYAKNPVATLVKSGIVKGDSSGLIKPLGLTTRAELAVVMFRLVT